jgi:coenzyme F420-reducing hydrogenase alpha subunit
MYRIERRFCGECSACCHTHSVQTVETGYDVTTANTCLKVEAVRYILIVLSPAKYTRETHALFPRNHK